VRLKAVTDRDQPRLATGLRNYIRSYFPHFSLLLLSFPHLYTLPRQWAVAGLLAIAVVAVVATAPASAQAQKAEEEEEEEEAQAQRAE
jgi:hypothetical protein